MKRWIWVLAMIPVMWVLWRQVLSADCLYLWNYSAHDLAPPTEADYTRAAITFWGALLTPVFVGLVAAIVAYRRKHAPSWPVLETIVVALPYLVIAMAHMSGFLYDEAATGNACLSAIILAYLCIGGVVVVSILNIGACARQRVWRKLALSVVPICGGMFFLFWWNAFIIYIDT
jgi:hypothetical protein